MIQLMILVVIKIMIELGKCKMYARTAKKKKKLILKEELFNKYFN